MGLASAVMSPAQNVHEYLSQSHPLPDLKASTLDHSNHDSVAVLYNHILHAEALALTRAPFLNTQVAVEAEAQDEPLEPTLVNIRFVGWLLVALHQHRSSLGDNTMHHVVEDVWRALHEDATKGIQQRGELCRRLVRQTWTWRCNKPTTQTPDNQYTFADYRDWLEDPIEVEEESGPWNTATMSKFKLAQAFERDGFGCLVTPGNYCDSYADVNPDIMLADSRACRLESARIVPHLRDHTVIEDSCISTAKVAHATDKSVLNLFGLSEVVARQLAPEGIDHLTNILSLSGTIRHAFESLYLWFEATEHPNQYRVECAMKNFCEELPLEPITFCDRSESVIGLPHHADVGVKLPDPCLLAVHASCAFAITMSGEPGYERVQNLQRRKDPHPTAVRRVLMEDMQMNM